MFYGKTPKFFSKFKGKTCNGVLFSDVQTAICITYFSGDFANLQSNYFIERH